MGILDWWHGRSRDGTDAANDGAVLELVERIVDTTNPRLRFVWHYQQRLAPVVASAMAYLVEILMSVPAARAASAAGWSSDPYLRAFFATPDDLVRAFSRSADLRAWFEQNPLVEVAYGVLGMEMNERRILGLALENGAVRQDVEQTTVSFGDYRVRICGGSEAELRQEIEGRMVNELALAGLAQAEADQTQRTLMEQERALLLTRKQILERQGGGLRAAVGGDEPADQAELGRLQAQLEENTRNLAKLGMGAQALEGELDRVVEALADARQQLQVSTRVLRLDRMNVVQAGDDALAGEKFEFQTVRIPGHPPRTRAFVLVCVPRADLLPGGLQFDEAARLLL